MANIKDMAIQMGRRAIDFVRYHVNLKPNKGTFLSEDIDVFVLTPNRRTFLFSETEKIEFL